MHDVRRVEAEIDELRLLQAAHAQAGDDQQDERARDLGDDHRAAQALAAGTRRAVPAVVQERPDVRARRAQRRHDAHQARRSRPLIAAAYRNTRQS